MEDKNKSKINEKVDDYFEESINFSNFKSQQMKDKLNLRKNKIFNKLFNKRKENFENNIKGPHEIDINSLNLDENIKKDIDNYLKNNYEIKKWFKYIFSSNKNEVYVALYLLNRYIELQIIELKIKERLLSRNDTELIQKMADNLLSDDLKISYISCKILTNLTSFPTYIENRIYSEKNLEKYLKFFDRVVKDISLYTPKALILFNNISTNDNVKIYLIKHNFIQGLFDFIKNILNNQIKFFNDLYELETIKYCIRIILHLILICSLIDPNYMKYFTPFIPFLKIITNKYFVNVDNIAFNEKECYDIISLWILFADFDDEEKKIKREIIKDNFTQVLIKFYKKMKNINYKISIAKIFCYLSTIGDDGDKILINDGFLSLLSEEIEKYQYSNVNLLNYLIYCVSNLSLGTIGENNKLIHLGIIYKIMDIAIFYIDDKLDEEVKCLLLGCLNSLTNNIFGIYRDTKKEIITYKNNLIIKIFCKALKLELKEFEKEGIIAKIILAINDLNVISEEIDIEKEKEYDLTCINNSLVEILNNIYNKNNLEDAVKSTITDIIDFIKDKEENNI